MSESHLKENKKKTLQKCHWGWFRTGILTWPINSTCRGSHEGAWSVLSVDRKGVWSRDRKCMEAKALQTIDTLYITRYSYNNIAGTYCTDKIELYGWRKLLVYSIQQTWSFKSVFNLFFFSDPFSFNPSSLFSLINSSQVSIYMYIAEHTHVHIHSHMLTNYTKKKKKLK